MHTGTLKKLALALTFWLALHTTPVKATALPVTYGSGSTTFGVDANALLYDTGVYGTGTLSLSGAGTRLFFYPSLSAFRAGSVDSDYWDTSYLGSYSTAFGYDTEAIGEGSTALGAYNLAGGQNSLATGMYTTASGYEAVAQGYTTTASGYAATSTGFLTLAVGSASTASGLGTEADACFDFVVGIYNVGTGNATTWVGTDPIFEVGNGGNTGTTYGNPSFTGPADAFVVYKNGTAAFQSTVTVQPSGDIPMYNP